MKFDNPRPETQVNHPPEIETPEDNRPLNLPIYQNVKWQTDSVDESLRVLRRERAGFFYSRVGNPSVRQLELMLAQLQGRSSCLASASGVNAIAQCLLSLTRAGDHIVFFIEGYSPTRQIIRKLLARFGITHSMLSIDDLPALERELAARPTRLVFFESPTNPVNKIADIPSITALTRKHGALTVLDNTAAGFHQHGQFDIDVFIHSLTKFTTGAGDVMGGAVIADESLIGPMRADYALLGAQLDALSASLMVRGMKTYFVRYRTQSAAALQIARFLEAHPAVAKVRYPGLESHAQAARARAQMSDFGTVITFDLRAGFDAGRTFAESLRLFARTPSFGSTESLVVPPQMMQPRDFSPAELLASDIGLGTVRLSIGLEDPLDLQTDLSRSLELARG